MKRIEFLKTFSIFIVALVLLAQTGCLKKIPYQQDQLDAFYQRSENVQLEFRTKKGRQVAFYLPPLVNPEKIPARIAILYPGIHSVALGWLNFISFDDDPEAGYLLIDYPGRGLSEGFMHPEENYKNSEGALDALAAHFGMDSLPAKISLLGHSFGTGAALQFALRHKVEHIVLVAPYNTLSEAIAVRSKLLALVTPAEIDNLEQVRVLLSRSVAPDITVIHGAKDMTLPVHMGRELANVDPVRIAYHEVPEGDHTTILTTHRDLIFHTLLFGNGNTMQYSQRHLD